MEYAARRGARTLLSYRAGATWLGSNLATRLGSLAVKGNNLAVKGVNLAVKGINLAVKGISLAVKGISLAVKGINLAVKGSGASRAAIDDAAAVDRMVARTRAGPKLISGDCFSAR